MRTIAKDRRKESRGKLAQLVRVRPGDSIHPAETCTTLDVSSNGLYFVTSLEHYCPGMNVYVTRNFRPDDPTNREDAGSVVRVDRLRDGKTGVAVSIFAVSV